MDRVEFDKLGLKDQVSYINDKLLAGVSLTKECEKIGIDRTTIRKRFLKDQWSFDKASNQYIKLDDKSSTKVLQKKPPEKAALLNPSALKSLNDFEKVKADLFELLQNKEEILDMIKNYKSNTNIIEIPELNINIMPDELKDIVHTRSLKIYDGIYNIFDKLSDMYPSIKKQDLTSLALYEFYLKYKK